MINWVWNYRNGPKRICHVRTKLCVRIVTYWFRVGSRNRTTSRNNVHFIGILFPCNKSSAMVIAGAQFSAHITLKTEHPIKLIQKYKTTIYIIFDPNLQTSLQFTAIRWIAAHFFCFTNQQYARFIPRQLHTLDISLANRVIHSSNKFNNFYWAS